MPQPGESSVEEILESIKKVIARDNRAVAAEARVRRERAAGANEAPEPSLQDGAEEVLDLDEAMEDESADNNLVESDDVASDTDSDADNDGAPLLTDTASNAMRNNLAALAMMSTPRAAPQIVRSGETSLEGLAREMLRPMLAEWLDANLPNMVEKMVQAEISRIASKKG